MDAFQNPQLDGGIMSEALIVLVYYNAFVLHTGAVCGIDEVSAFGAVVAILIGEPCASRVSGCFRP